MVVKVEQIREGGLTLDEQVPVAPLAEALEGKDSGHDTGFRVGAPSILHATFHKVSGGVMLSAKLDAHVLAPCKRCLTDVKVDVPVEFSLNFVPHKVLEKELSPKKVKDDKNDSESAASFDPENADQEPFDGKTIDLDPIVREQVLLALPMDAVCREDCQGLCPMCGVNRNEKKCSCEEVRVDPRLAALKDIKLN